MAEKEIKEEITKEEPAIKAKSGKKLNMPKIKLGMGQTIIAGVVALLLVLLTTVGVLVYGEKNESAFIKSATRVLPFPAAIADGSYVTVYAYLDQLDILKSYYKEFKKLDFNSDEGKNQLTEVRGEVMDRVIEDAIISVEAKKMKVSVSKDKLNEEFDKLVASNGGEKDFSDILQKYYGLTMADFKTKIYAPTLLRQEMTNKINEDENNNEATKQKAEEVLAKVKAGGKFADIAKEESQDPGSAENGGDLGYFGKGKMVPEFEKAAFALKVGQVSGLVKTTYGYHIIKVTAKKGKEIRASHILIRVRDFNDWLADKKEDLKNTKTLGIFPNYWQILGIK